MKPGTKTARTELKLPWPPSVNVYWRSRMMNGKLIRFISGPGKKFTAAVAEIVASYRLRNDPSWPVSEGLQVHLEMFPPAARKFDIDNFAKAPLDALVKAEVFSDDRIIHRLLIERCEVYRPYGMIRITFCPYLPRDEKFQLIG